MARPVVDIRGLRFGRWIITGFSHIEKGHARWHTRCDCGATKIVDGGILRSGNSQSCGCLQRELADRNKTIHGHASRRKRNGQSGSPEYRSWQSMIQRCKDPNSPNYKYYGGRGIWVCDEWRDFVIFLRHMGPRPPGTTLDRIDPRGGYEKNNCRWATWQVQNDPKHRIRHK